MSDIYTLFNKRHIGDRQISELVGIAHGIIADGRIDKSEAEYLQKWLVANQAASENPIVNTIFQRVEEMLSDGLFESDEAKELLETLDKLVGGTFEIGETLKSSSLPLTKPVPKITIEGQSFCFTGTFAFGNRKACEAAITARNGLIGNLNANLNFLVIGIYATDSWAQSSWGRKIEKAVNLNTKTASIKIVSEADWTPSIS
jgi:NAD-dependent DNA ligase